MHCITTKITYQEWLLLMQEHNVLRRTACCLRCCCGRSSLAHPYIITVLFRGAVVVVHIHLVAVRRDAC